MIYSNSLKQSLKQHFEYDELSDTFSKITSKFLPSISDFLTFWENNIIPSQNNPNFVEELEINELYELFRRVYTNTAILEKDVLKLIRHFFSDIQVIENKYILNVTCHVSLWNKNENIKGAFYKKFSSSRLVLILSRSLFEFLRKSTGNQSINIED